MLGNFEHGEQHNRENDARDGGLRLRKQVDDGDGHQHQRDQAQTDGNFPTEDHGIQWHAVFAVLRVRVAQYQHRDALHRKTPDHAESVEVAEEGDVAAAGDDRDDLERHHQVNDAMRGAETRMRMPEPIREDAIFRDAIQNAVGTDNRGVHGPGENQRADHHHKHMEAQSHRKTSHQVHCQAANQILGEIPAHAVRNNHHREERNQRSEHQAVNKYHQPSFLQVLELGMLDLPVNLREGFFAAHRQHRMAQADENNNQRDGVRPLIAVQPAERTMIELHVLRVRQRRQAPAAAHPQRIKTPADQHHHHDGGELHDAQSFAAGFGHALDILPPEIKRDDDRD